MSPNFLVWKFCGKAQFPHSFKLFVRSFSFKGDSHKLDAVNTNECYFGRQEFSKIKKAIQNIMG